MTKIDISGNNSSYSKSISNYDVDAWGRDKAVLDKSLLHGMFTFSVPVTKWKENLNGVEVSPPFVNASSVNGKLHLTSGLTLDDKICLDSFQNPRYEPNRGHLYSSSIILPDKDRLGNRRFGFFTEDSGAFFSLESGVLYGVIRSTVDGVALEDKHIIDIGSIDLEKGNVFDIQMQWRGVGNYIFYINLKPMRIVDYLGTRTELSMFNPANPIAFECENKGDEVVIECGCVDVTTEGGTSSSKTYGSISVDNEEGQVDISGFNVPIIAVRSKHMIGTLRNTRDTLMLLASAYADNKSIFRVWATRDDTAITSNQQVWSDYEDGHLEYLAYDTPNVTTPMSFDTTKASSIFSCRVGMDTTYATSALFEGRTDIHLHPGDIFILTMHRETGGACKAGVTLEFAEEI